MMIKVVRGAEISPGIWSYSIAGLGLSGRSRQPLLDGCRQIERMGADPAEIVGVFREGRSEADISCPLWAGAKLGFSPYREFAGVS